MRNLPRKYLVKGIKDNENIEMTLIATSVESAREQLSQKYHIYPIEIKPLTGFEFLHLQMLWFDNKVTRQDLSVLFLQISIMLGASLPILEVIEVCAKNIKKPVLKRALLEVAYRLNLGQKLSFALKTQRHIFGDMVWSMVALGEKSGDLSEIFDMLSSHLAKGYKNESRIKRALLYPFLVFLSIIAAFVGMVMFVLPEFLVMFNDLSVQLPIYTKILIHIESFFRHFGIVFIIALVIMIFVFYRFYKHSISFKTKCHNLVLYVPFIGEILKLGCFYHYTWSLFLQLKSATPLDLALNLSNESIPNLSLKSRGNAVLNAVKNGKSFSLALAEEDMLDNIALALIGAGERSGKLAEMLEVCAQQFQEKAQEKIDFLISLIEPILSLVMGLLLLILALGVFVPMWDMSSHALSGV